MKISTIPRLIALPLLAALAVDAVAVGQRPGDRLPVCQDFIIPVHAVKTAQGDISLQDYDANVLFSIAAREVLVTADYELSARLCEPPAGVPRKNTLQFLLHGATFNKVMWDFPYKPEKHSWVRYMTSAGYTTLAVDFLGAGNSSTPHGFLETQTATFVENTHEIIQRIRSEGILGRTFTQIALVGFSIGGIVANSIADKYPTDADHLVLLGISWDKDWMYPAFIAGLQTPGRVLDPAKWGHIDSFYQTQPTINAREVAAFHGNYDAEALRVDFETRDLDSLGTALSFTFHVVVAREFTGSVFLGIGKQDSSFCPRVCGSQPYGVYDSFPTASDHTVRVYENTGHALLYHHVAPDVMRDAQQYLDAHAA